MVGPPFTLRNIKREMDPIESQMSLRFISNKSARAEQAGGSSSHERMSARGDVRGFDQGVQGGGEARGRGRGGRGGRGDEWWRWSRRYLEYRGCVPQCEVCRLGRVISTEDEILQPQPNNSKQLKESFVALDALPSSVNIAE